MFTRAGEPISLHCDAVYGGGVQEGTMVLAPLSDGQSLPPLPTIKLGPSGADSWVGRFVYIIEPCGFLQLTLLWGWEFLPLPQPPQVFSARGFEVFFPCWNPWFHGLSTSPVVPPGLSARECGTALSTSCHLATSPFHPAACLRTPYQSGWMFLLYLLGCWTSIQFNFLSILVVFLFLNLLLSFFWLCKEAQCVYLCLHLGWKSSRRYLLSMSFCCYDLAIFTRSKYPDSKRKDYLMWLTITWKVKDESSSSSILSLGRWGT